MPQILLILLKFIMTRFVSGKLEASLGLGVTNAEEAVKMNGAMAYILALRSLRLILIGAFIALVVLVLGITMLFIFIIAAMNLLEVSDQTKNIVYLSVSGFGLTLFGIVLWQLFSEKNWVKVFKVEQIISSLSE